MRKKEPSAPSPPLPSPPPESLEILLALANQVGAFLFQPGGALGVQRAVEVLLPFNPGLEADGAGIERGPGPDGEIGVLARLQRADALVDAKLFGGVEGDKLERLHLGRAAVFDRLGGFGVKAAGEFGGVGVEGDQDAPRSRMRLPL